jgi:hypothetical protein
MDLWFDVAWGEPGEQADQIMGDEDLTVAIGAGSDSDGRNGDGAGDFTGDEGGDEFEDDGEGACIGEGVRIGEEGLMFGFSPAFDVVAPFEEDVLGEHAEMSEEGDSLGDDGADGIEEGAAAFGLDGLGAGSGEASGIGKGEVGGEATTVGQIGGEQSGGLGARGGADMMFHIRHGDVGGIGVTENDHAEGVADQEEWDAGFVEQAGEGIIVGCEGGDGLLAFEGADGGGSDAGSVHGRQDCFGPAWGQGKCRLMRRVGVPGGC